MDDKKLPRGNSKLRTLVYTGLAGGMLGVCGMSLAAHGNASPASPSGQKLSWEADNFVVSDPAKEKAEEPVKQ